MRIAGGEAVELWHGDADIKGVDAVVLPGGFSYGDYLRCGAISRFAPVMGTVVDKAQQGLPVLGICNGFQILCESHLLPGALTRNGSRHFICRDQKLRIESSSLWTSDYTVGQEITAAVFEAGQLVDVTLGHLVKLMHHPNPLLISAATWRAISLLAPAS